MKTRGWIDFYLPQKLAYHLKIVLGSFITTIFFSLLWTGKIFGDQFWFMLCLLFVQLEVFMLIARKIFKPSESKSGKGYKKAIILKLIKFYLLVLLIATIFLFISIAIGMVFGHQTFEDMVSQFIRNELKGVLLSWLMGITIGSVVFFYMEWNQGLQRIQKLREEKLIFQNETLKNQVKPHFLFNSLNTLSSLVAQDPVLADAFIANLSGIYRYILENQEVEMINLSKELEFVERYFFLQKIRDNGKIELLVDLPNAGHFEILPISIQLLVENALKHNVATKSKPLHIKVGMSEEMVVVENEIRPKMQLEPSSGIGLKNLSERVKLIMNKEVLKDSTDGIFTVKIPLKPLK